MQTHLELSPEDEAKIDAEREAHLVAYRRKYWQHYKACQTSALMVPNRANC